MKTREISAFRIYWAEFFPTTGKVVTKHDRKQIDGHIGLMGTRNKTYRKHFPNKEKAIEFLKSFDKKLDKRYKVLLFTDHQFGLTKWEEDYAIHYTKKQQEEVYYIG